MKAQIEADRATRMREARKLALMLNALNTMPKPLIGRIHGAAFGCSRTFVRPSKNR
jgi:hypothetical protein